MEYDILNDILTMTVDDFFQDDQDRHRKSYNNKGELKINTLINSNSQGPNMGPNYRDKGSNQISNKDNSLNLSRDTKNTGYSKDNSREGSLGGVSWNLSREEEAGRNSLNSSVGSYNQKQDGKDKTGNYAKRTPDQKNKPQDSRASNQDTKKNYKNEALELLKGCNVEEWLKVNSPKLLEESLKRLNLDISIIENRNLDLLGYNDLQEEKKRVKNELKRYDTSFNNEYKRFPDRKEKEPMRPLYLYYKRLKQAIGRAPKQDANYDRLNENAKDQKMKVEIMNSGNTMNNSGSLVEKTAISNISNSNPNQSNTQKSNGNGSNNLTNLEDMKTELERLKKVRGDLRVKLENYQDEFMRNHNRKIRYRQDIIPVESDYNLYKSLKIKIKELEDKIQDAGKKK